MDWVVNNRMILNKGSVDFACKTVNPNLFDLNELGTANGFADSDENFIFPPLLRLTKTSLEGIRWCLLDDGFALYLYIHEMYNQRGVCSLKTSLRG